MRLFLLAVLVSSLATVGAQRTNDNVEVDLQPCILAKNTIEKDVSGVTEAYLFNELFKGMWSPSQYVIIAPGDDLLDLITVDEDHGRCNSIFVGIIPSTLQKEQLTAYSQRFQVRIVYFDEALTADDSTIMTKLGMGQFFVNPLMNASLVKLTGAAEPRVVSASLQTDPRTNNIYTRPVIRWGDAVDGIATIVADYADAMGESLPGTDSDDITYPSAAAVTYTGNDGEEEMHLFFAMAWFDLGSWAWAHYIAEWATKGIFAGERRFWLGAMVDDLFLGTNVFEYGGQFNEGDEERMTGTHLESHLEAVENFNNAFNAKLVTEFPFNGNGILEEVSSPYLLTFDDADAALLPKGSPPQQNDDGTYGQSPIHAEDWWSQSTVDALKAEFDAGQWASDGLLASCISLKEDFFWQSHTMSHLARDDLAKSDCDTEDGGNARMGVITGLFDADTYAWRSMTTPGITGLFNPNCLSSAVDNLITCAPGDNTYDGVQTAVSLINQDNQFHSLYTTEETNGYAGFQIVPRFATYVYYNCVTTECLVLENLYVRRVVCGCEDTNPGTIDTLNTDTAGCETACSDGLQELGSVDKIFDTEAKTTARWIMNGRRDKYMFHQANIIPTSTPGGTMSLLDYWYHVVLTEMATYLNLQGPSPFPLQSVKFDDLCMNFRHHEELDSSGALITVTKTPSGTISGMSLTSSGPAGVIPVTIPKSMTSDVSTTGLPSGQPYASEVYGSDLTYYVATSAADEPADVIKPTEGNLVEPPTLAT